MAARSQQSPGKTGRVSPAEHSRMDAGPRIQAREEQPSLAGPPATEASVEKEG